MTLVAGSDGGWVVWIRNRVKNPDINEGAVKPPTPYTISCNIQTGLLVGDRWAVVEHLSGDGLKMGLDGDVVGYPFQ